MYIVHRFLACVIKNLKSIVLFDQKEQESVFWFLFIAFLSTLNKHALITKFKRNGSCFSEILCVNGINATTEDETRALIGQPSTCKVCYTRCTKTSSVKPRPTITTFQSNISQNYWAQHVACVSPPCCDVLRHVGCCKSK